MKEADQSNRSEFPKRWKAPSRPFDFLVLATSTFLGCILCVTPSFAQKDPQPVTSPVIRDAGGPKTGDTPPNADELGISIGSFRLYPSIDLRAGYDTNVFAQPAGQQVSSAYEAVRPSLDLRSDWSAHMLNLGAYGVFGWYNNASTQNYQNFGVTTDGRLDIQRDWYLSGSAAFARTTEALGTPDVAFATTPTVVYSLPLSASLFQRFNRLFYQASVGATRYSYQTFSQPSSTTLDSGSRDRTEYGENLRTGYEIYEGFDVWVQGGLNQRRYLNYTNTAGQQRDSTGWSVTGGSTIDLGGISKLEGYVGFSQQTYLNPLSNIGALVFGLAGAWNGYEPLIVRPFITRSINETAFTNYQSYVSTTIGAEFIYALQTEWQLNGGGSFSLADYTPVSGSVGTTYHTDKFYRASLGLLYSIRPQLQIGPLYEFAAGYGPDPTASPNYNRHVIMMRLVARR